MTPQQAAAIELEHAIAQAIVRYEQVAPGGICIGVYVDRSADGMFKVKPRLKMKAPMPDSRNGQQASDSRIHRAR